MTSGEVYWLDVPLPGEPSGGRHMEVIVSSEDYLERTAHVVAAALRRGKPSAYRIPVRVEDFTPFGENAPLDQDRIIGLDQCNGFDATVLAQPSGVISSRVLAMVKAAIPRQYQLEGPWSRRGEVWETNRHDWRNVVLIMSDVALANPLQKQWTALPVIHEVQAAPLLMLGRHELTTRVRQLDEAQQHHLSNLIAQMFGI